MARATKRLSAKRLSTERLSTDRLSTPRLANKIRCTMTTQREQGLPVIESRCSLRRRETGFTLIEALIAFVILSVGLLGIVSLQSMAKTSQHLAIQHSRAVTLADDLIERIRVNPSGMPIYQGVSVLGDGSLGDQEPVPNCRSGACTPAQLAAYDLWAWERALDGAGATVDGDEAAGLIEPRGCINFTPAPGKTTTGTLVVMIQWRGLQESSDAVQEGETICGGEAAGTDRFRRQVLSTTYVI